MLRRHAFIFSTLFLFITSIVLASADERHSYAGLSVYSDLNFVAIEGEYYGLQIIIVPYVQGVDRREKLLWRSAGGRLDEPLLLDVTRVGNTLKVHVPKENDFSGEWTLMFKGRALHASGPRGFQFDLLKLPRK